MFWPRWAVVTKPRWRCADQQGADDAAGVGVAVELDHADAVGQVVDDPDLALGARGDGDRLEADRDRSGMDQAVGLDPEQLQAVVRRVDREQVLSVGRYRERAHLTALEQRE
jgi:hypothetical protein